MKTMKRVFAGIMISVSSLLFAGTASANNTTLNAYVQFNLAEISQQDVIDYLINTGHTVLCSPVTNDGGRTWKCKTQIGEALFNTTVFVENDQIVGHDDEEL